MKFEDLMVDSSQTVAEQAKLAKQAAFLENRMIAIRTADRRKIVENLDRLNGTEKKKLDYEELLGMAAKTDVFDKVEHRLEYVKQFCGVNFINDSKACNVNATYFSLEKMKSDVVWIAGGNDMSVNYRELLISISQKVKTLICIGKDNRKLVETFIDYIPVISERKNMEDAVRTAFYSTQKGGTILLSPSCDCDDLYPNYQVRGETFKRAVAQL
jgi:UDP-N-acetylmuramoylalanine-D-glutamate ligase